MFETIMTLFQNNGLLIATSVFLIVMTCIWYVGTREDKNAANIIASSHDLKDVEPAEYENRNNLDTFAE